jgi:hypothetical protein
MTLMNELRGADYRHIALVALERERRADHAGGADWL